MNKETVEQKQKTKTKSKTGYIVLANRLLVMMVIASGILYLGGTNDLAIKHFVVQENKRKMYNLKDENRSLETKVMALSSFNAINKKVANLKMVKVDKVDYVVLNQVVAKR